MVVTIGSVFYAVGENRTSGGVGGGGQPGAAAAAAAAHGLSVTMDGSFCPSSSLVVGPFRRPQEDVSSWAFDGRM